MRGTLVCAVDDSRDGRRALETAVEVSDRLGLRLVLAHAVDVSSIAGDWTGAEGLSTNERGGVAELLSRLATEFGVADRAEGRSGTGDPATVVGRIAAEEAADLIVVGSKGRGRLRRGFESRLAGQLRSETPVPVLIAPPREGRRARMAA